MVDSLKAFSINTIPDYMKTQRFKQYIESMLSILQDGATAIQVTPTDGYTNRGDLTGYLLDPIEGKASVPMIYHYTIMRLNGMSSVAEFNENISQLYLPDANVFSEVINLYKSSL